MPDNNNNGFYRNLMRRIREWLESDAGQNYIYMGLDQQQGHRGHLNTRACADVRLNAKCAVAATMDILCEQDVCFKINNGTLYRYE